MKIKVKTNLIEVNVDDDITMYQSYTKRSVPELDQAIKVVIDEAIKLHNQVAESIKANIPSGLPKSIGNLVDKKETV